MRVTSDRQTLILAGETPPRRGVAAQNAGAADAEDSEAAALDTGSQHVTIISARLDAIVTQGLYTPSRAPSANQNAAVLEAASTANTLPALSSGTQLATLASYSPPAIAPKLYQAYAISTRSSSSYGANAYARTRDLADKTSIIDTYA